MLLSPLEVLILVSSISFFIVYVYIVYIKHAFKIFSSHFSELNHCFICLGFWISLFYFVFLNYRIDYSIDILSNFFAFLFIILGSLYSYKESSLFNFVKERKIFPFNLGKFGLFLSLSFPIWMILILMLIIKTPLYIISYSVASSFFILIYKKTLEALDG
jgi:hypothetical protein